jgi:hypothetical protein
MKILRFNHVSYFMSSFFCRYNNFFTIKIFVLTVLNVLVLHQKCVYIFEYLYFLFCFHWYYNFLLSSFFGSRFSYHHIALLFYIALIRLMFFF